MPLDFFRSSPLVKEMRSGVKLWMISGKKKNPYILHAFSEEFCSPPFLSSCHKYGVYLELAEAVIISAWVFFCLIPKSNNRRSSIFLRQTNVRPREKKKILTEDKKNHAPPIINYSSFLCTYFMQMLIPRRIPSSSFFSFHPTPPPCA